MTESLNGARIILTGMSRGVGLASAARLLERGASILGVARDGATSGLRFELPRRLLALHILIDRELTALLDSAEIRWLDSYHRRVAAAVGPLLQDADRAWLEQATRPLG